MSWVDHGGRGSRDRTGGAREAEGGAEGTSIEEETGWVHHTPFCFLPASGQAGSVLVLGGLCSLDPSGWPSQGKEGVPVTSSPAAGAALIPSLNSQGLGSGEQQNFACSLAFACPELAYLGRHPWIAVMVPFRSSRNSVFPGKQN